MNIGCYGKLEVEVVKVHLAFFGSFTAYQVLTQMSKFY